MTELQQLLPYYLNSGVKVKTKHGEICTLTSIGRDYILLEYKNNSYLSALSHSFSVIKLLCRPLSDLNEEITVEGYNDGESFEPVEELMKFIIKCSAEEEFLNALTDDWCSAEDKLEFAPFSIIQQLIKWHFWIGSTEGFKTYCEEIK